MLATPWPATEAAVNEAGDLTDKVVIDCTNPLKPDLSGLAFGYNTSAAEQIAEWARGAKVFKAFNTTGYNIMANPVINGTRTVMFVCGDDAAAKPKVLQLASDIGFDAVDASPLTQARLLEPSGNALDFARFQRVGWTRLQIGSIAPGNLKSPNRIHLMVIGVGDGRGLSQDESDFRIFVLRPKIRVLRGLPRLLRRLGTPFRGRYWNVHPCAKRGAGAARVMALRRQLPRSTVLVSITGIDEFRQRRSAKGHKYRRPESRRTLAEDCST